MPIGRRRGKGFPLTDIDLRRIVAARLERGWSVADLATRVGLHQSTLYRLENGTLRSTPRLDAIYEALDLPTVEDEATAYSIQPALIDAGLHFLADDHPQGETFLPVRML